MKIRKAKETDIQRILEINFAAFTPVHESFRNILGKEVFELVYPDWKASHKEYIESLIIGSTEEHFYVVEIDDGIGAFIHFTIDCKSSSGEIGQNAVDPVFQGRGIGKRMYRFALNIMKKSGISHAVVCTGGDPSHLPARKAYEGCGFTELPLSRYYQKL